MSHEQIEQRPEGLGWCGYWDRESGMLIAEAYFKMSKVSKIISTYLDLQGNMANTLKIINDDVRPNEEGYIKPEEITTLVDWASRNRTEYRTVMSHE